MDGKFLLLSTISQPTSISLQQRSSVPSPYRTIIAHNKKTGHRARSLTYSHHLKQNRSQFVPIFSRERVILSVQLKDGQ
jgi:hypothetical protein